MGRMIVPLAAIVGAASIAFGQAAVVRAATWAEFGTPTATSSFSTGVRFEQPVTIDKPLDRVELLLTVANLIGPLVIPLPAPESGATTLSHLVGPDDNGHILPNTPLVARWRLVSADDPTDVEIGPPVRVTYEDDRFDWQTVAGDLVRVHWYQGTRAFGDRALKVGEDAVAAASTLLRVTETDPVDFYVYGDRADFYDALGPGTRENIGGQANAEIRTMFALIPTTEIDNAWVGIVIPHELTHLVFDTATANPYHSPPHWLNEGLGEYLSGGYDASYRSMIAARGADGTLVPLEGLAGTFPTSAEGFDLGYAEGVSAVDYLVRAYGKDSLVSLIRSYADGRTDDEAFRDALGVDVAAFGAAWLEDVGATPPSRRGPQSAPPGPIPSAWLVEAGASGRPAASDNEPGGTSQGSPVPGSGTGTSDGGGTLGLVVALAVIAAAVVVAVVLARRRRRSGDPGAAG